MPQSVPLPGLPVSLRRPAHRTLTVLAAVGLAVGLVGCSAPNRNRTSGTEYSDTRYERSEIGDCDAGDRRDQEMPDCGRLVNGVYREWDWVRAGRVTPPNGWSPPRQQPPGYSPPRSTGTSPGTGTKAGATTGSTGGRIGDSSAGTGSTGDSTVDRSGTDASRSGGTTSGGTRSGSRPRSGRR